MTDEARILLAKHDDALREEVIKQNMDFVRRIAAKTAGRFVDDSDDACSEALIAFNDAIDSFDQSKGAFYSYASKVITNRVTDWLRTESRHSGEINMSALGGDSDDGSPGFDPEDSSTSISDAAVEIYSLKRELADFHIEFNDLAADSPKSRKTKQACLTVIDYVSASPQMTDRMRLMGILPSAAICRDTGVKEKILERHRKYLIAGILIRTGDYHIIAEYLPHI